jgi:hypothetical protein
VKEHDMKKADVSTPSPRVEYLEGQRQLVRTIMGGTFAMREAGQKYLPKHPAESDGVYKTRLEKTFLDNFVSQAIDKAADKLFAKPIKVDDVPPDIETLLENIDRQGRALDPFMMDVAKQAFTDGVSFVMADMPPSDGIRTLAEEKQAGIRPYALHIKPQDILETVSEMIGGVETLTRVRMREVVQQPDGWEYVTIEQIRVWYREPTGLVRWELYRQGDKKEWIMVQEGATTFKQIYLVPFYTNRVGLMEGLPPFQNIAESNLEHWQWKSEHAHALSMQCFGMLTAVGVSEESEIQIGPAKVLRSSSPDAKFAYTETTGTGVTLAADALKAIEGRIESAGVNLRVENAGQVTATAAALDSEEANAALKAVAAGFSDSIELLFQYFAEMLSLDPANAGEAHVNDDFGTKKGTDAGLQEITKGRALGDISREAWLDVLRWRGELPEYFDAEEDAERLQAEGPALGTIAGQQPE